MRGTAAAAKTHGLPLHLGIARHSHKLILTCMIFKLPRRLGLFFVLQGFVADAYHAPFDSSLVTCILDSDWLLAPHL